MAGNTINVTLAGDATSLDRALDRAGQAALDAGKDFDRAADKAREFGGGMDKAGNAVDASEGKFMASADLLDGLGGAFGLPTEGATGLMRSFGDLAGGVTGVVLPAMKSMWAVMAANPVFLVIAAIVALGAAIYLAYQKFEGFRNFVHGVFDGLKRFGANVWDWIPRGLKAAGNIALGALEWIANAAITALTAPYQVINRIPGIKKLVPDIPKVRLPRLAEGGIVTSPTVALIGEAGPEAVVPLGRHPSMAGGTTVNVYVEGSVLTDGRSLADVVHQALLTKQRSGRLGLT